MKKTIIAAMVLIQLTTSSTFANNNDYINNLNNSFGEMKIELEDKNKLSLLKGIDKGYLIPEIENDENLKDALIGLNENFKNEKIEDKELKEKHELLVSNIDDLISLLDETIDYKKEVMNENTIVKVKKLLFEDDKKVDLVNNKIDEINQIYRAINNL